MAEYKISIYGSKKSELDNLASWIVNNELYSENIVWLIQLPQLYNIYKEMGIVTSFQTILDNVSLPLFEVTINPDSHPQLHAFLKQFLVCIAFIPLHSVPLYGGLASFTDVRVLYAVRIFLGLLSVISEAALVVALSRKYGKRLACYTLALLCLTSDCFFASTIFLPSSFSMYAISLSSALFLFGMNLMVVAVVATGVIIGWQSSVLAFLPITVYSLLRKFKRAFISGAFISITLLKHLGSSMEAQNREPAMINLVLVFMTTASSDDLTCDNANLEGESGSRTILGR
ncbi:unnamed protein product [Lactuca saligna]|uniref:Mannosyltransferase n=1 Tax=Lactuca saligna TaxID=75948 RepID=A0AA35VCW0_LACSI|nr:unnamed protein product [Lactuca saligna]